MAKHLEKENVYEAVRHAWRLSKKKAEQAELVLAMQQGLVVGVFLPEKWMKATAKNFPGRADRPGRLGFIGHEAPENIAKHYLL